ncbi:MAG: nitroreductase [Ruminococcaceae bacterium]|nr:nitroreductase [Oscillospiraceae bacterium]
MEPAELIHRRKTTRSFTMEPAAEAELQQIRDFIAHCRPLVPGIRVRAEIIGIDSVRCILPWKTPHYVAIFTEDLPLAPENVGFLFQQAELFIQSLGLGTCWLGMGKLDPRGSSAPQEADGLQFVIMIAFGHPKGAPLRSSTAEFRRKTLREISDQEDIRLEPARLAPSSVNSQPWYFIHDGEDIHAFCALQGLLKQTVLGKMNRIDMGIALAHLYLSCPKSFRFFSAAQPPSKKGYAYIGTFRL